ncbi:MAG: DMT family transporter [Dehalococcoidia bacterium]
MDVNLGIPAAIAAAAVWAASSVMMASQLSRVDAALVSAVRLAWAAALFLLLLAARGDVSAIGDAGWSNSLQLIAGAIVGLALGDTVYVVTLGILGAGRAYTASLGLFTVFTFVLSAIVLDEPVTATVVAGSVLVVGSVYLVALLGTAGQGVEASLDRVRPAGPGLMRGLGLVVFASLCWAVATVWLGHAGEGVSTVAIGAIRIPAAAIVVGLLVSLRRDAALRWRSVPRGAMAVLGIAGLAGTGFGSLLFIYAIQEAGAGRTAVLSSLSPLFAVPLGAVWLREPITGWVAVGTVLAVLGIMLISV